MEPSTETKKASDSSNKVVIAIAALIIVIIAAVTVFVLYGRNADDSKTIGYASTAKVMLDKDALQAAMDEAMANSKDGNVALLYKNNAYSENGTDFKCYIVNSSANSYDMFLTIFADADLKNQLFLSELLAPGSGFEEITLDHALEAGDHRVYVAVTQVKLDDDGKQVLHKQVIHTMDFHVTPK